MLLACRSTLPSSDWHDRRKRPAIIAALALSAAAHAVIGSAVWMVGGAIGGDGQAAAAKPAQAQRLADVLLVVDSPRRGAPKQQPEATPVAAPVSERKAEAVKLVSADSIRLTMPTPKPRVEQPATAPSTSKPVAVFGEGGWSGEADGQGEASPAQAEAFAGLASKGQQASSVVFVVDASGPMVSTLPAVLRQVRLSVSRLLATQTFSVVLLGEVEGDGAATRLFSDQLVAADSLYLSRLGVWLANATPRGRSNPLAGLRAAIAMRPQVVFVLSRSIARSVGGVWDQGKATTLAELDTINPRDAVTGRRPTIIKTIQFLEPDPTGIMQAIADEHGGARAGGKAGDPSEDWPNHRVMRASELR